MRTAVALLVVAMLGTALALAANPASRLRGKQQVQQELAQARDLERVIRVGPDKTVSPLSEVYSHASKSLIATTIYQHCRPTIIKIAARVGAKHCGLIFKFVGADGAAYPQLMYVDLGLGDMFYARLSAPPSDAADGLRAEIHSTSEIDPAKLPAKKHVADIYVRWEPIDPSASEPKHVLKYDVSGLALSEKRLMHFILSYNHHFPYYSVTRCNCMLFISTLLRTFINDDAAAMSATAQTLNPLATLLQTAVNSLSDTCFRHFDRAEEEEQLWRFEYLRNGGAPVRLERSNLGGFHHHAIAYEAAITQGLAKAAKHTNDHDKPVLSVLDPKPIPFADRDHLRIDPGLPYEPPHDKRVSKAKVGGAALKATMSIEDFINAIQDDAIDVSDSELLTETSFDDSEAEGVRVVPYDPSSPESAPVKGRVRLQRVPTVVKPGGNQDESAGGGQVVVGGSVPQLLKSALKKELA